MCVYCVNGRWLTWVVRVGAPSKIFKPHSQFSRLGMWTICLYIYMYLFFSDVIGVCLILILYEFYLFISFYIVRSLTHYILLTYFSKLLWLRLLTQYILLTYFYKLLRLRFLTHYILLTYFYKLLRLRFLTHYTLITSFSKPVEAESFNTTFCLLIFLSC